MTIVLDIKKINLTFILYFQDTNYHFLLILLRT